MYISVWYKTNDYFIELIMLEKVLIMIDFNKNDFFLKDLLVLYQELLFFLLRSSILDCRAVSIVQSIVTIRSNKIEDTQIPKWVGVELVYLVDSR